MKKSKMTAVIVAMCILLTSVAGTITASADSNIYQNKLSPQLMEEINTSDEETICVYISLLRGLMMMNTLNTTVRNCQTLSAHMFSSLLIITLRC